MSVGGLLVASARLPVTLARRSDGWEAVPSAGGLVAALNMVLERSPFQWFGWPGTFVPESEHEAVRRELRRYSSTPVFVAEGDMQGFHQNYSNQTLWPLLHGRVDRARFDLEGWHAFRAVSEVFADSLCAALAPNDAVWIHDYQLSLVPQLLRERGVENPIGFFLHTPFPAAEVFRALPQREAVLRGLLGADLVGFQSHEFAGHFRQAAARLAGASIEGSSLRVGDRIVDVGALPVGIDPDEIRGMGESREARQELASLQTTYAGRRIVVGVDRFDYTKGIPEKLRAFETMLERYPRLRQRVVLIQVAQPSRMAVEEYQQLKRDVDELVGRINGRFGSASFTPVVYVSQSISRERIMGLYRAADVALLTPLVDGMNLVALEYVAAKKDRPASLVLSEFTGAAQYLAGARLVNPHDALQVSDVLADCLEGQPPNVEAFRNMRRFVDENTASRWADGFLDRLRAAGTRPRATGEPLLLDTSPLLERLRAANTPVILVGEGAVLSSDGLPSSPNLGALGALADLIGVCGVSRRSREAVESWGLPPRLSWLAEYGTVVRDAQGQWSPQDADSDGDLRELVEPVLREFVRHTPGSAVEFRPRVALWHCGSAGMECAALQTSILIPLLEERLRGTPYIVGRSRRAVEVRHVSLDVPHALRRFSECYPDADFVLCLADPRVDGALVRRASSEFGKRVFCLSVSGPSRLADAWITGPEMLPELLRRLKERLGSEA